MSRAVATAGALVFSLPGLALACPVCFDGPAESRAAFLATTAFLTLLPLGMLAGAGVWLRRRARASREEPSGGAPPRQ